MSERLAVIRLRDGALLPGERMQLEITGESALEGDRVLVVPERPKGATGDPLRGTIAKLSWSHETLVELSGVRRGRIRPGSQVSRDGQETAEVDEVESPHDPEGAAYLRAALDELAVLDDRSGISKGMFQEIDDASLLADIVALMLQLPSDERLALLDMEDPASRVRGAAKRVDEARAAARERHDRRHKGDGASRVKAVLEEFARDNLAYDEMEAIPVEDEATVDALVAGLSDPAWRAAMACTRQLGRAKAAREKALGALRVMLDHEEDMIQQAAVEALGDLGAAAEPAVPEIVAKLCQGDDFDGRGLFFRDCLKALGGIGGPVAARECASFVSHCLAARTSFDGLAAYRKSKGASPGDPPAPPDYAKPDEEVYDGLDLLTAATEALTRMDRDKEIAGAALREILRAPRSGEKARAIAMRGLPLLERTRGAASDVVEAMVESRVRSRYLHLPPVLDALFEAGEGFSQIVFRLVETGETGPVSYDDPTPALARFVAHPSFAEKGAAVLTGFLSHQDPRVRAEGAELAGFLANATPVLPRLRESLADSQRPVALAAAGALTRLRDARPATQQGLRALLKKSAGDPHAEDQLRDALALLGAPVPAPPGESAEDRALGFFPLPGRAVDTARLEGTTLFVPWHDRTPHPDPDKWSTDADRMGLLTLELGGATPAVSQEDVPIELPMKPTGAYGAKRSFKLLTRVPEGLLMSIASPFSDHRGWGSETFLLVFDPAARTWSWLARGEERGRYTLTWIDSLAKEMPSRSAAMGELILWREGDRLFVESDGTPYHLDDWEHSPATRDALGAQSVWRESEKAASAAKPVEGISAHRWIADGEVIRDVRRYVLEHDRRVAADELVSIEPRSFFSIGKTALALLVSAHMKGGAAFDSVLLLRRRHS